VFHAGGRLNDAADFSLQNKCKVMLIIYLNDQTAIKKPPCDENTKFSPNGALTSNGKEAVKPLPPSLRYTGNDRSRVCKTACAGSKGGMQFPSWKMQNDFSTAGML
jgi:hypothetical protein